MDPISNFVCERTGHSANNNTKWWLSSSGALAPSEQAAAAKGALLHAAARLPTAVSPIAAAPLVRLEKSTADVAAGACSPDSCEALACQGLHELQRAR